MQLKMSCNIEGFEEFQKNLDKLGAKVAGPIFARALRAGGAILADAQRKYAPVLDEKIPGSNSLAPGALKNDIQTMIDIDGVKKVAQISVGPGYATDHVALWLEEGHEYVSHHHGNKLNGKLLRQPESQGKHPFMQQAFEASGQAALNKAIELIAAGINGELGEGTVSADAVKASVSMPASAPRASSSSAPRSRTVKATRAKMTQANRWQQYVHADRTTRGDWSLWQKGYQR